MEYICSICNEKFNNHSKKANHIRWKHKSEEFLENYIEKIRKIKLENDTLKFGDFVNFNVLCNNCQKSFITTERVLKFPSKDKYFCCISCSNTRKPNEKTKNKIRIKIIEKWKNPEYSTKCIKNLSPKNNKRCSSKGEREIRYFLKDRYGYNNVLAHRLVNVGTFVKKSVDITIKNKNIILEYDGIWHFDKNIYERLGTLDKFEQTIKKDELLKIYCVDNKIRLLRISEKHYLKNKRKSVDEIVNFIENDTETYKELY